MSGVLEAILASKRREAAAIDEALARGEVAGEQRRPRGELALRALGADLHAPASKLRLIAENKRKSPSAGVLSTALSPAERAIAYARGGASMVSVLCDGPFFDGAWEHVAEARRALDEAGLEVPVLAKEFVVGEGQLAWAARHGADAVLVIVRIVPAADVAPLVRRARALGMEPLVEIATEAELPIALDAGATLIGVNARDLDALAMDAGRAARVLAAIPEDRVALYLSGLKDEADVRRVAATRADGALVGEALMRLDDPRALLARLVAAAAAG
ncbi:MAG TPA: indole-3-glycerol phosphate synthase TrpC [Labilithrix sp.]|jgi:indole-3-glycerol phosphate synthase